MRQDPHDPLLYRLVSEAVAEGFARVNDLRYSNTYIGEYYAYPQLSYFQSGFPSINHGPGSTPRPTDYTEAFVQERREYGSSIIYPELDSFSRLIDYARRNERLKEYFVPRNQIAEGARVRFLDYLASNLAIRIIDRYIHLYGDDTLVEDRVRKLYLELEAPVFEEELPAEVLVPVVLTRFSVSGALQLTDDMWLEELDEPTQLARAPRTQWGWAAHETVAGAATHALVLKKWIFRRSNSFDHGYSRIDFYPLDRLEPFFDALRIVRGVSTGYAQVVLRPVGWADDWTAGLPPLLHGPVVRRYPQFFDDYGWLKTRTSLAEDQVVAAAAICEHLQSADRRTRLASRRLSSSMLRTDEEDAVIDLCIGFEALLGDKSTTEITHKLALRTAAVCGVGSGTSYSFTDVRGRQKDLPIQITDRARILRT